MTYTINGKDYTEFDINKRCADLMGVKVDVIGDLLNIIKRDAFGGLTLSHYDPCTNWNDAGPIIEKCWDELMGHTMQMEKPVSYSTTFQGTKWQYLMQKHNCTKLIAACICFIELKEQGQ